MKTKLKIIIESQYFTSNKMKGRWCKRVLKAPQYQVVRSKTEQAVNRGYHYKINGSGLPGNHLINPGE
ncbi:MAG: hypothetical protein VB072_14450 [Lentimicrobium sp.]|jgi:hypothetical protein|uniref:hypothetical protein n=1 Tax=Lentimicrobium sp. TaxID=2034841 RepID=UPI002B20E10E|nr:hypothetical protein [Lentimicrobium sp.]MEA5111629.1 hypothetical protein [Lentimicrobium sp.]